MYLILSSAVIMHLTVLNGIKIFAARPDLILIGVVFFGLFIGPSAGLEAGAFAGFMCDIFALDFFGINAIVYALAGLTAGLLSAKVFKESKRTEFAIVIFFTVFSMSLHFILEHFMSRSLEFSFFEYIYTSVLPASIYTGVLSIPIFFKLIDIYDLKELQGLL
jgi:rod shape-determining protein MreD